MDELLQAIRDDWSWAMPPPQRVCDVNKFGNVLVLVEDGSVWHICPEDLEATEVAGDLAELESVRSDPEFQEDWAMTVLVEQAEAQFGAQPEGRCFCLKIPGVLGGEYSIENMATNSVPELVSFAGHVGKQIEDLPDGAQIRFDFGSDR